MPCKCDNSQCGNCACVKAKTDCTEECHGGHAWKNTPCLYNDAGRKVKSMPIKDVRAALCANALSPVGDRGELLKRLAVFFHEQKATSKPAAAEASNGSSSMNEEKPKSGGNERLFSIIMENEGDHHFVLSLSGKKVSETSAKGELRKAYLLLSTKVHPDKNGSSTESKEAFQVVLNAFERLANPEKFEEEDDDSKPAKKRKKTEQFTRSNKNCFKTRIECPQCKTEWGQACLGLEDAAYNFFMQAIKQYICGLCSCEFGCMTALHYCPHCRKQFEYDPDDYHRQITCGKDRCKKLFGFTMFKVTARREMEVRKEAKVKHEQYRKRIAQKNRRAARAGRRVEEINGGNSDDRLQEKLFLVGLVDACPRCGWELPHGEGFDEAQAHLEACSDQKAIAAHKKRVTEEERKKKLTVSKKETQAEVMAVKQWEHNGRQVGQLWMLGDATLERLCGDAEIPATGKRHEVIMHLSKHLRSNQRLMITDGRTNEVGEVHFDTTSLARVDEDDLPQNINEMERDELQDLCASYGVAFNTTRDVKNDLLKKFLDARTKGKDRLMICDKKKKKRKIVDEDDESEEEGDSDADYVVE